MENIIGNTFKPIPRSWFHLNVHHIWLIAFCILITESISTAQNSVTWIYYPWTIDKVQGMETITNDSESLSIAGEGIEISLFQYDRPDDDATTLQEFAAFLGRLFRLEEPDPIHPFQSDHLKSYCMSGYKEFDRIVIIVFEENEYRFFAVASFDDDNLQSEELALSILKTIRRVEE